MRTAIAACTCMGGKLSSEDMMKGPARMGCGLLTCLWQGMEIIRDTMQPHGNIDVAVKWVPIRQGGIVHVIEKTDEVDSNAASRLALRTGRGLPDPREVQAELHFCAVCKLITIFSFTSLFHQLWINPTGRDSI